MDRTSFSPEATRFFFPTYVGVKGWIDLVVDDDTDWDEVEELVEDSHREIATRRLGSMCRSIKTLRDLEPQADREAVEAAALQFVRKISGYREPSRANREVFDLAVQEVADSAERLLAGLVTRGPKPA